jgi:hypothetical protein
MGTPWKALGIHPLAKRWSTVFVDHARRTSNDDISMKEVNMKRRTLAIGIVAAVTLAGIGLASWADEEEEYNPAALAKALPEAKVSLDQGLKASEREGKPISAKYEVENGALQLSVYTEKGGQFSEVIVDHLTGSVKKAESITDDDDLKDAKEQSQALAKAKVPLDKAVQDTTTANSGYRAVSVVPTLSGGQPVAAITLVKGDEIKKVTQKLD